MNWQIPQIDQIDNRTQIQASILSPTLKQTIDHVFGTQKHALVKLNRLDVTYIAHTSHEFIDSDSSQSHWILHDKDQVSVWIIIIVW